MNITTDTVVEVKKDNRARPGREEYRRQYYLKNKAKINALNNANYLKNKAAIDAQHKEYDKQHAKEKCIRVKKWQQSEKGKAAKKSYYLKNKKQIIKKQAEYKAMKLRTDPLYRAIEASRNMIRGAISRMGYTKKARSTVILGCSFEEFKQYMEAKFTEGMTWLNHGDWHIDHIIPLSSATSEEEVLRLNHYTNLQPLWALHNLQKGITT